MRLLFLLLVFFSLPVYAADWEKAGSRGMMEFVVVNQEKTAEKEVYLEAINIICAPDQFCHVMFWSDKSHVPTSWPMTEKQWRTMTLDYFFNPKSKEKTFTWNCDFFDEQNCGDDTD
ncbi:hypothetical protein [Desulfonatronum sp. SC1]|uniref:hypothetical protein n=1 Tax=Desulfonatronum sp. SC1 TaxID=2109626 RepID=UPI000D325966|nr:hypothetical protein [Desulfonatronum sp. SC1]